MSETEREVLLIQSFRLAEPEGHPNLRVLILCSEQNGGGQRIEVALAQNTIEVMATQFAQVAQAMRQAGNA